MKCSDSLPKKLGPDFDPYQNSQQWLSSSNIYFRPASQINLTPYVSNYLKDEIATEGLVRKLACFFRFFSTWQHFPTQNL